jgi:hypothetical protein
MMLTSLWFHSAIDWWIRPLYLLDSRSKVIRVLNGIDGSKVIERESLSLSPRIRPSPPFIHLGGLLYLFSRNPLHLFVDDGRGYGFLWQNN